MFCLLTHKTSKRASYRTAFIPATTSPNTLQLNVNVSFKTAKEKNERKKNEQEKKEI